VRDRPFIDKARQPTTEALADVLAGATGFYDELLQTTGGLAQDWNHSKASGWMLKVHDRKKALFYVVPLAASFRISLTVRPEERTALAKDPGVAAVHDQLRAAKKYAEGYALQFLVAERATRWPPASSSE
jgi:hypothetical protein